MAFLQYSLACRAKQILNANGISLRSRHIWWQIHMAQAYHILLEGTYLSFVVECDNPVTLIVWTTSAGEV